MKPIKHFIVTAGLILFLVSCAVKGCALVGAPPPEVPQPAPELAWPNPPETPRIRYLRTIATPKDLGIAKSFWRRIWEFVVGSEDERISVP